ncbi:MAG: anaerobic ribonucleoside-triphosphate reductase activating protein [Candidatus Aminicenantaceae bacterium]
MVEIKGLEKFAPKDFPGFISSTVFVGGCNFRCPYCHNSDLVLRPQALPTFPLDYFIRYLDSRRNWLEAICISGGEPLLHEDIEELVFLLKERSLLVKIDTNGAFPSKLENLINEKLIDYVAVDVKAPMEKYRAATGSEVMIEEIARSIEIILNSSVEYIFRTTIVPGLIGPEDIVAISQMLKGSKIFQLQQFLPRDTIDAGYLQKKPYSRQEIQKFAEMAKPYFEEVRIEGV